MFQKCQKFYQIEETEFDTALDNISHLLKVVHQFVQKSHNHIKYLVFLVNNLVESEDLLELLDENLPVQNTNSVRKMDYHAHQTPMRTQDHSQQFMFLSDPPKDVLLSSRYEGGDNGLLDQKHMGFL